MRQILCSRCKGLLRFRSAITTPDFSFCDTSCYFSVADLCSALAGVCRRCVVPRLPPPTLGSRLGLPESWSENRNKRTALLLTRLCEPGMILISQKVGPPNWRVRGPASSPCQALFTQPDAPVGITLTCSIANPSCLFDFDESKSVLLPPCMNPSMNALLRIPRVRPASMRPAILHPSRSKVFTAR